MNQQVCSNIVDLNKKPEPKPETGLVVTTGDISHPEPIEIAETFDFSMFPGIIKMGNVERQPQRHIERNAVAMFKYADASYLKRLFEAIQRLQDEVIFHFESDQLRIRHMDPSRVAMIDYTIKKEYFEEWDVKCPGVCCFNIEEVIKIVFAKLKKDTWIGMYVDTPKNKITFKIVDSRTRERTFPMLEVEKDSEQMDVPAPKLLFDVTAKIVAKDWQEDLAELKKVSDHVAVIATEKLLRARAEGDLVQGENKYEYGSSEILLNLEVRKESKAVYSLSYLSDGIKADPSLSDLATLEFSDQMPIRVTMHTKFGDLYSYLAPRIETD